MPQTDKVYEVVPEGIAIMNALCEKQPDVLWAVNTKIITVLGITNKERPKNSRKLAKIMPIKGPVKAILMMNNIDARIALEVYYSDWNVWSQKQREMVIFHELIHISAEMGKMVKHDVEDWALMIDKFGYNWFKNADTLPSLLNDKIEFDLKLRPNVPEDGKLETDTGDEIVKKDE